MLLLDQTTETLVEQRDKQQAQLREVWRETRTHTLTHIPTRLGCLANHTPDHRLLQQDLKPIEIDWVRVDERVAAEESRLAQLEHGTVILPETPS